MSLVERPPDPDEPGGLARVLSGALLGISAPFIRELVAGVVLIALMVLVLPLAVVVFIATSLLYYGVVMLLGMPSGDARRSPRVHLVRRVTRVDRMALRPGVAARRVHPRHYRARVELGRRGACPDRLR